jgi:TatD DNase family protein
MIDAHTHLDQCEPQALGAAHEAGLTRLLSVGTEPGSCTAALAFADADASVFAAIGCHPNLAELLDEAQLRRDAAHPRCVAIGETGLDYFRDRSPREAQRRAFEFQIDLARELDKPLVIHTRDADEDTLATLHERAGGVRVMLHCFSMVEHVGQCIEAGWWLSFAGNVTYPKNTAIAAAAVAVPLDRLLVETDAPYLAPQSRRGRPNEPAAVVETAAFIAAQRGISYAELETAVGETAASLFGW